MIVILQNESNLKLSIQPFICLKFDTIILSPLQSVFSMENDFTSLHDTDYCSISSPYHLVIGLIYFLLEKGRKVLSLADFLVYFTLLMVILEVMKKDNCSSFVNASQIYTEWPRTFSNSSNEKEECKVVNSDILKSSVWVNTRRLEFGTNIFHL